MAPRKRLFAVLLVLAFSAAPELLWLGAHALAHHEHAAGHHTEWPELAKILTHGHQHAEGEPDHEHNLVPSSPLRQAPPRDVQALAVASPVHLQASPLLSRSFPSFTRIEPSGASPPLLDLLCVLLI
ncbi:MAG TPA: hypothetical protein VF789_29345 [Thermoanaerobaculia bacterium]